MTSDQLLLISHIDHIQIAIIPENDDLDEPSKAEILADFCQAWHEAMTGQTIPLSQLWEF